MFMLNCLHLSLLVIIAVLLNGCGYGDRRDSESTDVNKGLRMYADGDYKRLESNTLRDDRYSYDIQYDTAGAPKPLIIYLHEGAFVLGNKDAPLGFYIQGDLAEKGVAVAKINYYKLTDVRASKNQPFSIAIKGLVGHAMADALEAVAYFKQNAHKFNVNPERIYLMGFSAGAITALHAAHTSSTDWRRIFPKTDHINALLVNNAISDEPAVAGVIGISGGIFNDAVSILRTDKRIPTLLYHHEKDNMVPIDTGVPFDRLRNALAKGTDLGFAFETFIMEDKKGRQVSGGQQVKLTIPIGVSTLISNMTLPDIAGSKIIANHLNVSCLEPREGSGHSFMISSRRGERGLVNSDYHSIIRKVERFVSTR